MDSELLDGLQQQLVRRPLDGEQRQRIALHMRACGVSSIRAGELLFRSENRQLQVFQVPAAAAGELTPF